MKTGCIPAGGVLLVNTTALSMVRDPIPFWIERATRCHDPSATGKKSPLTVTAPEPREYWNTSTPASSSRAMKDSLVPVA